MPTYVHTLRNTARTCISSVTFTVGLHTLNFTVGLHTMNFTSRWLTNSSDFGLLGNIVPKNGRFLAQDADEPLCKI